MDVYLLSPSRLFGLQFKVSVLFRHIGVTRKFTVDSPLLWLGCVFHGPALENRAVTRAQTIREDRLRHCDELRLRVSLSFGLELTVLT